MVVLDSDHMSLLQRGSTEGIRIASRLRTLPPDDIATTIVSFEEQSRGWLARIARAKTIERQLSDYKELKQLLRNYCDIAVIDFDADALDEYQHLKESRIQLGTMDLKIAAIALARRATLLTRNSSDFSKVPGLIFEDWSAE